MSYSLDLRVRAVEAVQVMAERGAVPEYLRSDNGPEFIEAALNAWLKEQGVRPTFITPGSPWENGKCESFNGKFRKEFLDRNVHFSLRMQQIRGTIITRSVLTVRWITKPHLNLLKLGIANKRRCKTREKTQ